MSTILDIKGNKVVFMDAPKSAAVEPLTLVNLGKYPDTPYYHGGGLLPGRCNRSTRVLTPSIYARPGKWGQQRLSHEEVLKAKDLTGTDLSHMDGYDLAHEFYEALIPGKCLTEGTKALMYGEKSGMMRGRRKERCMG